MSHTATPEPERASERAIERAMREAGRRPCINGDGRPAYMAGLCGECFAAEGRALRAAAAEAEGNVQPTGRTTRLLDMPTDLAIGDILDEARRRIELYRGAPRGANPDKADAIEALVWWVEAAR